MIVSDLAGVSGAAGVYFRIWIVNLFFTLITFGIYSAWAKVRKKKYFYGSTRLDFRQGSLHRPDSAMHQVVTQRIADMVRLQEAWARLPDAAQPLDAKDQAAPASLSWGK